MGGGALGQRVTPKSEASSCEKDFKEERYSFNYDELRSKGTMRSIKEQKEGAGMSLIEALQTAKGHRIGFSIILYGIALIIVIFLLSNMFGGGPSDDFYVAPNGVSVDVRPMWNRR